MSQNADRYLPLILADLSLDGLRQLGGKARNVGVRQSVVTQLATSPHRLSLASIEEYRDRLEAVSEAEAAETRRAKVRAEQYARTGYTEETKPKPIVNRLRASELQ